MMVEPIEEVLGTKLPGTQSGHLPECGSQWDGGREEGCLELSIWKGTLLVESTACLTHINTCLSCKILVSRMFGMGM